MCTRVCSGVVVAPPQEFALFDWVNSEKGHFKI